LDSTLPNIILQSPAARPLTTPTSQEQKEQRLRDARLAGGLTAATGAGLTSYWVVAGIAGGFVVSAVMILVGGFTAYLSHRRLHKREDFSSPATPEPTASQSQGSTGA